MASFFMLGWIVRSFDFLYCLLLSYAKELSKFELEYVHPGNLSKQFDISTMDWSCISYGRSVFLIVCVYSIEVLWM